MLAGHSFLPQGPDRLQLAHQGRQGQNQNTRGSLVLEDRAWHLRHPPQQGVRQVPAAELRVILMRGRDAGRRVQGRGEEALHLVQLGLLLQIEASALAVGDRRMPAFLPVCDSLSQVIYLLLKLIKE